MSALRHSRDWRWRVLPIIGLSIAGWIIVYVFFILAHAAPDIANAWPRTDFSKRNIELSEVQSGGPPKDGIPSIDKPVLTVQAEADTWLDPREPVIAVTIKGQVRAYPLQILLWHEIVNDEIAGFPISATYCPLCDTAVVFDRQVNDKVLEFGVSGKLRNSDMVMYDRQTES